MQSFWAVQEKGLKDFVICPFSTTLYTEQQKNWFLQKIA